MKRAVIVGGSSDIGMAIGERLCSEGWEVVSTYFSTRRGPGCAELYRVDVRDLESLRSFAEYVRERFGGFDLFVYVPAVSYSSSRLMDTPDEMIDDILGVGCRGAVFSSKYLLPLVRDGGCAVFVSSIVGLLASRVNPAYAASRSCIFGLVRSLCKVESPRLRVFGLLLGAFDTRWWSGVGEVVKKKLASETLVGRLGRPEEVADAVLFLCGSGFATCNLLELDGGRLWS